MKTTKMRAKKHKVNRSTSDKKFDFNWLLAHPHFSLVTTVHGFSSGMAVNCITRFLFGTVRAVLFAYKPNNVAEGSITFFTSSKNQFQALRPVAQQLKNACVVEMVDPSSKSANAFFPLYKAYLKSIPDFIALGWNYRKYNAFQKLVIKSRGDLLALAPSLEAVAINFLQANKPAAVVVSNDTVLWGRAVLSAAKSLKIPTVYLQHAPVSDVVPPLNVDFAFLDGMDAATKYHDAGGDRTCRIYLSGGPRQDQLMHLDESQKVFKRKKGDSTLQVGVCTNMVDDINKVSSLLKQIIQICPPSSIILRSHPKERRISQFIALAYRLNIRHSDNSTQSPEQFIDKVDLIIAGDSSMLLDAALSKKKVIKSDLLGIHHDYMGLIASGLVIRAQNSTDLSQCIESAKKPLNVDLEPLRQYCATIDTPWHGRSTKLVADEIINILNGTQPDLKIWRTNNQAQQFELKGN